MSNSPLVRYAKMSPNHSGKRTRAIDRITPHCVVGQCDVGALGELFAKASRQTSSNYGIGTDGQIGIFVEECNRSWCSSNEANDQRAVTIECASDTTEPYAMNDAVYQSLIYLCADICRRNGKTKLLWLGDKEKTLSYTPKADEMVLTVHRWFANKSCPGVWLYSRLGNLAEKVTKLLIEKPLDNTAADWALRNGILRGDERGDLMLHSPVTREQVCVMLKRYHDAKFHCRYRQETAFFHD